MQTFEFWKSDNHRPSDRNINDGNKDRKTLRCRTGILALTVSNAVIFSFIIVELYSLFFVCSLNACSCIHISAYLPGPRNWRGSEWSWVWIYAKVSRDLSCETDGDFAKLCSVTTILTNRFYIVNKSAQTTNLLYALRVESFYVVLVI